MILFAELYRQLDRASVRKRYLAGRGHRGKQRPRPSEVQGGHISQGQMLRGLLTTEMLLVEYTN